MPLQSTRIDQGFLRALFTEMGETRGVWGKSEFWEKANTLGGGEGIIRSPRSVGITAWSSRMGRLGAMNIYHIYMHNSGFTMTCIYFLAVATSWKKHWLKLESSTYIIDSRLRYPTESSSHLCTVTSLLELNHIYIWSNFMISLAVNQQWE